MQLETILTLIPITILGLLPMVNPPTTATLLLGLSRGQNKEYLHSQARSASLYLFTTLCVTFFIGASVLEIFSITIPSLRLGGGLIIGSIGFKMLFPAPLVEASDSLTPTAESVAFVPLTIPSMCGPGTMALVISGASELVALPEEVSRSSIYLGVLIGFICVALIAWVTLSMAYPMLRFLGKNGVDAFTRIMGFLLVCMGAQFCVNGVSEVYNNLIESL